MEYEEFKEKVLTDLQEKYGGDAVFRVKRILKNNGKHYDGIVAEFRGEKGCISQSIPVEWFYRLYCSGNTDLEGCIQMIAKSCEENRETGFVMEMLQR